MPVSVTCSGCGKSLKVKSEYLGRTLKCPDCGTKFTAEAQGQAGSDRAQQLIDRLVVQWPLLVALILFLAAGGYFAYVKTHAPHVLYVRLFVGLIACGIAALGYWALSSDTKTNY